MVRQRRRLKSYVDDPAYKMPEEAIVQASPYAGFPAAWSAAKVFSATKANLPINGDDE